MLCRNQFVVISFLLRKQIRCCTLSMYLMRGLFVCDFLESSLFVCLLSLRVPSGTLGTKLQNIFKKSVCFLVSFSETLLK